MLVSFEGQDGAGKTALLTATREVLAASGIASVVIEEFSASPYGARLLKALTRDKFLRVAAGEPATFLSRALEVVADLYYQDEREIAPALRQGAVVLKDRHLDTIVYTLAPTLIRAGALKREGRAITWLASLCGELRHRPDLTVYVDAPLRVRIARIQARASRRQEARANQVSKGDIEVFQARERIARQLIAKEPARFLVVDSSNQSIAKGARNVAQDIVARHGKPPRNGRR